VWLFLSIDCFLGYWAWRLYICPRNALKQGDYLDLAMMSLHWIISYLCIPNLFLFFLMYWLGANYMFGNFALSHTHLPVTEEATHWVQYGLSHTANIKPSPFVDWWMGYLNYQIEHHLFPTLPQYKSHLVVDRVKALASKHNLPYHSYSYGEAWVKTLKNFNDVAKEFRS
jgi:fatty acid desaturase 2 (delta-6 desaturase)